MKEELIIYYAPFIQRMEDGSSGTGASHIMFKEPEQLFGTLSEFYKPPTPTKTFFQCPAVKDLLSRIYAVYNPVQLHTWIDHDENGNIQGVKHSAEGRSHISTALPHSPSMDGHFLIVYEFTYLFFCEEPLMMKMTSPYFQYAPHQRYGMIVPGEFDIGRWFRPPNFEFNLWPGQLELKIDIGEPLAYFEFMTDRKIVFKQFEATNKLRHLSSELISFKPESRWRPLKNRYEQFEATNIKKIIMKEIKSTVL